MKQKEINLLNLFATNVQSLTSSQIKAELHVDDPSETLRDLIYFGYLIKTEDGYQRTSKAYNEEIRKTESKEKNYEIVLNKVFTGSFLTDNLGHELVNFLVDSNGQRYVFLNPYGNRGDAASTETKYAFHVIESSQKEENSTFELVAISKIDNTPESIYSSKNPRSEKNFSPIYNGHSFYDIFHDGDDQNKAHIYTYKATCLYKPNGYRILIKFNKPEARLTVRENEITIDLMCNLQHSICYADATGKATYESEKNEKTDLEILYELLKPEYNYIVESTDNVDINTLDDEQCFSVINDRTKLEDSMSNQIAYFLKRDSSLTFHFLHDFLEIEDIEENETFNIIREKEKKIDLLFKSNKHIVVIENKIDSNINSTATTPNNNGKYNSQLSVYYKYICDEYPNVENKKFFVLAPEYNTITQEKLNTYYEKGENYTLKTYNQLYDAFMDLPYMPLGLEASDLGKFLFKEFLKSIQYLTWSTAKQHENTAYIRLKQRIQELERDERNRNNN